MSDVAELQMSADDTAPKQRGVPFPPGQSGNPFGRPKGSRSRLSEDFLKALSEDFDKGGIEAIAKVRADDPVAYVKVVAGLLPKELKIEHTSDLTDEQLDARIRQLADAIGLEVGISGSASREGEAESPPASRGVSPLH